MGTRAKPDRHLLTEVDLQQRMPLITASQLLWTVEFHHIRDEPRLGVWAPLSAFESPPQLGDVISCRGKSHWNNFARRTGRAEPPGHDGADVVTWFFPKARLTLVDKVTAGIAIFLEAAPVSVFVKSSRHDGAFEQFVTAGCEVALGAMLDELEDEGKDVGQIRDLVQKPQTEAIYSSIICLTAGLLGGLGNAA